MSSIPSDSRANVPLDSIRPNWKWYCLHNDDDFLPRLEIYRFILVSFANDSVTMIKKSLNCNYLPFSCSKSRIN